MSPNLRKRREREKERARRSITVDGEGRLVR